MRSPINPVTLVVGLGVVACAVAGVLYMQRGAHTELKGAVLKVRTQAMDEKSAVAVVDFRFANPATFSRCTARCLPSRTARCSRCWAPAFFW